MKKWKIKHPPSILHCFTVHIKWDNIDTYFSLACYKQFQFIKEYLYEQAREGAVNPNILHI